MSLLEALMTICDYKQKVLFIGFVLLSYNVVGLQVRAFAGSFFL